MARSSLPDADLAPIAQQQRKVKQMVRWISKHNVYNPQAGYEDVETIDATLSGYLVAGYKVVGTHFLGENPEAYGMLYVLVLD